MICVKPSLYIVAVFLLTWRVKWQIFVMKEFLLGCRVGFEDYVKKGREVSKCSLKNTEVLLHTDDMSLRKFDIYHAPNCFKSHTIFFSKKKFCLMSGLKSTLCDITLFLPENLSWVEK